MQSLGVIGGLGAQTTAEFYTKIVYDCQKQNNEHRPLIVISNVPQTYKDEAEFLESGNSTFLPLLITEAKRLEAAGVDFLVIPCNSLHCHIDEIRNAVKIHVISIVDATITYIKKNGYKKIGLLSTRATINNKVYENDFIKNEIDFLKVTDAQQTQLGGIIQRLINGEFLESDRVIMQSTIQDLKSRGADSIALACTDLQLLSPTDDEVPVFDTMGILADASVQKILESC